MGSKEQSLAKQAMRAGQPLPDRIANAPQLIPGLHLYLNAFFDLDSERSHSFGYSRIPLSAIREYAIAYEFEDYQQEDLIFFIKRMDSANADHIASKEDK